MVSFLPFDLIQHCYICVVKNAREGSMFNNTLENLVLVLSLEFAPNLRFGQIQAEQRAFKRALHWKCAELLYRGLNEPIWF